MTDMYNPDCSDCKGTGDRDSGGTHPWGAPIYLRCDCDRYFPPINIMKLHPTTVLGLEPTEELGRAIAALRYDLIAPVLNGMIEAFCDQQAADEKAGKVKLAYRLNELSDGLENAHTALDNVLSICKEHIEAEKAAMTVMFKGPVYMERVGDKMQFTYEGQDYLVEAPEVGFAIGAKVADGKATLVYR